LLRLSIFNGTNQLGSIAQAEVQLRNGNAAKEAPR
jgi:hypothetical protein